MITRKYDLVAYMRIIATANGKDANAAPSTDEIAQASTRLHLILDDKDIEIEEQIQVRQ